MITTLISILLLLRVQVSQPKPVEKRVTTLALHQFSLDNRYDNSYVNDVFKKNILLTIRYATADKINIEKPFITQLVLKPGDTFAFHDDVLPQYEGKVNKTTNAHFNAREGFISDGYLVGDGVCHLASLLYWVAKDAGLNVLAPTRHDFAPVPEVPREYGVSIYNYPKKSTANQLQNLYISNTKNKTVAFLFNYDGQMLTIKAVN